MNVLDRVSLEEGHQIEFGKSTWNPEVKSIRNRYPTSNGGFSPHSSSEIPLGDLELIVTTSAKRGWIDVATITRIAVELQATLESARPTGVSPQ
jgi:hypothetical protein